MTTEQIVYVVILTWLATGLGLGLGWSRAHIRANKAEQREGVLAAVVAAKDDTIEALETQVDVLGQSADNLASRLIGANVRLAKPRRMNDENVRIIREANEVTSRRHWLPPIEGNYLDTVANLPVGWRLDWAEFVGNDCPIGMGVLSDHIADVVPLRGRS